MALTDFLKKRASYILVGLSCLIAYALQDSKPEVKNQSVEFPTVLVKAIRVERDSFDWELNVSGEIHSLNRMTLVSEISGKIVSTDQDLREGGSFAQGEELLRIAETEYVLALDIANAELVQAHTSLTLEKGAAEIRRQQWLKYEGDELSAKPLQLNAPQVKQAEARLAAAKANLSIANLDLERTRLIAPFTGRVIKHHVGLGQYVSPGTPIAEVFSTEGAKVRIPLSEEQLDALSLFPGYGTSDKSGMTEARVIQTSADKQYFWSGYISSVDAHIDPMTRLVYATVLIEEQIKGSDPRHLAPGSFVDVVLTSRESVQAFKIPRDCLRSNSIVFLLVNGRLKKQAVETYKTSSESALVDGLSNQDLIVCSPVPGAYEGMPIRVEGHTNSINKV